MAKFFLAFITLLALILFITTTIKHEEVGNGHTTLVIVLVLPFLIVAWMCEICVWS